LDFLVHFSPCQIVVNSFVIFPTLLSTPSSGTFFGPFSTLVKSSLIHLWCIVLYLIYLMQCVL
jgi:hypothetical protein